MFNHKTFPLKNDRVTRRRVLFIINPSSGEGDNDSINEDIHAFCQQHDLEFRIYTLQKENNTSRLEELQQDFKADTAVIAGGDGTLYHLLPFVRKHDLETALIPSGTSNGLATELGISQNLQQNLNNIIEGTTKRIDLLSVNNKLAAHICDIGFNAKLVKRFDQDSIGGFRGYAKHFIEVLRSHKPRKYMITDKNGQQIKHKAHMLIVTNAQKYGTGAVVNPQGQIDDGQFELIVIRYYSFWHILQIFFVLFTRRIHRMHYVHVYKHSSIELQNTEGENVNLDGEIQGRPLKLNIKNLPKALSVILPD